MMNIAIQTRIVWKKLYTRAPQTGQVPFFEATPIGMNAARSGKVARNAISGMLMPPEAYKYLQPRMASIANVMTAYSDL
jgi:hypothetical protein